MVRNEWFLALFLLVGCDSPMAPSPIVDEPEKAPHGQGQAWITLSSGQQAQVLARWADLPHPAFANRFSITLIGFSTSNIKKTATWIRVAAEANGDWTVDIAGWGVIRLRSDDPEGRARTAAAAPGEETLWQHYTISSGMGDGTLIYIEEPK